MSDNEVLVRVDGVSKKFCRSLKKSLWYGKPTESAVAGNELRVAGEEAEVAGSEVASSEWKYIRRRRLWTRHQLLVTRHPRGAPQFIRS